ncbi:MAG TPA: DUF3800 domain-containing protein [Candidatus Sulfotelmatobacter sp.]
MTTFQAFVDDSGTGKPVFVLSGYVSRLDWWEDFSDHWQGLLDEPPSLKYFKMREAATRSEQFGGMKATARNERIKKFFSLIRMAAHASVVSVVPIDLYKAHIKGKVHREFDDPYFLALFDIVMKILWNQIALKSEDTVDFIFDNNPRLAAKVPRWYQLTHKMLPPELRHLIAPSPKFEDDLQFLPLQAADAQSWYIRRLFAERMSKEPFRPDLPKEQFQDLDHVRTLGSIWTRKRCEQFASQKEEADDGEIPELKNVHEMLDYLEKAGEL